MDDKEACLVWFDTFIFNYLGLKNSQISLSNSREYIQLANSNKNSTRVALLRNILYSASGDAKRSVISNHQIILVQLLDDLFSSKIILKDNKINALRRVVVENLLDLLSFIENHYQRFMDEDHKIPDFYFPKIEIKIRFFRKLIMRSKKFDCIDDDICSQLIRYLNGLKNMITYRDYFFIIHNWDKIISFIRSNYTVSKSDICNLIIKINFNHPQIIQQILRHYSLRIQQEGILSVKSEIERFYESLSSGLYSKSPSVVDKILELMECPVSSDPYPPLKNCFKVQTSLPVPILAAFVRILIEKRVIINDNKKKVLEFIAANYTSIKKENISMIHLHSSYYDINPKTKDRLYDVFLDMAKEVKRL